jgi:beta-fructofuranosidase
VAVPPDGGPAVLFYTSVGLPNLDLGRARVAHPLDDAWTAWAKGDVVALPPDDPELVVFRDPCVFRDGGSWRMLVGGSYADGTATALAYRSDDLATWTYEGPFLTRHTSETAGAWTGKGWECPQLLAVDDAHVLVFSVWEPEAIRDVACALGTYEDGRFAPQAWQQLAFGGHYAASAFHDAEGRPGLIFWIRDVGGAGWQGALSVPYLLTVADGVVRLAPHPALEQRRSPAGPGSYAALDVEWAPDVAPALDVRAGDGAAVVSLTSGPGWVEAVTAAGVAVASRTLRVPRDGGAVRVLVDGPVLEVCTGLGVAGAQVVAPEPGVRVEPDGGPGVTWWAIG